MSLEFVKSGLNLDKINKAIQQEDQLAYLTQSKIQDTNLSADYLTQWAERNFETNDFFLNYVKSIFKPENFLAFYKYLRFPLPSSRLINNKIKPNLKRVFYAEDSYFKYDVNGKTELDFMPFLKVKEFNENIFKAILYKHNSIVISDLQDVNLPFREIISIKDVVAIDCDDDINRIAFKTEVEFEGIKYIGHAYIDKERYCFYNDKEIELINVEHDLEECPAHFIIKDEFSDNYVVKTSIFSHIRELMEDYNFLKTLQKMTEPNGALPITIKLKADISSSKPDKKVDFGEPNSDNAMGSQAASQYSQVNANKVAVLQAGSIIEIPQRRKDDGSIDTDAVQNFIKFIYIPPEALDRLNNRIKEIEDNIVSTIIGDVVSSNESAKNETQIEKSVSVLEDNLRYISGIFTRIRKLSDYDLLNLAYGKNNVNEISIFYGSDFFLETESMLYDIFSKSPNPIERRNILIRLNQNRFKHNHEQSKRQEILYNLLPFCSDKDFQDGKEKIDDTTYKLQTRFNYWISEFESEYGDIVTFYNSMENATNAQRYLAINNLITQKINNENSTSKVV